MNKNYYCVILAGGIGSRLWPSSSYKHPKQFLDIMGTGESLLQMTYKRYRKFIEPSNIIVVSNEIYKDITQKQLPELPSENLLLEPMRRNVRSCRKRSSLTWTLILRSPISSRKRVPPSAASARPILRVTAPVKAPFS